MQGRNIPYATDYPSTVRMWKVEADRLAKRASKAESHATWTFLVLVLPALYGVIAFINQFPF